MGRKERVVWWVLRRFSTRRINPNHVVLRFGFWSALT
jgi:hypothetical protein